MATYADYEQETAHLTAEKAREQAALRVCYERHGGDNPMPGEPAVPIIITQFGEWAVTPFGVECLTQAYQIQWDSLTDAVIDDDYWLKNLAKKDWVNLHDFVMALRHGRQIHRFLQGLSTNNTLDEA
jgi:hypothetical protein